ncbi:MAG TPA: arylesterase [Pseudolabrys sp.]|jgi:acyl-CoA thioesterase-1|nr:arylesterase [Pseudolabrys sp.]
MFLVAVLCAFLMTPASHAAAPLKIVALGDSLTAGYGLPADKAFPAQLQKALQAKGYGDVTIVNAGVSGDTTTAGLDRLAWSVPDGTDGVILELGANDALRGVDPKVTKATLEKILGRLQQRHIPVLLAGMQSPRNMGPAYVKAFDAIYPALASHYDVVFYPFFLAGVATDPKLNQGDGMHPNPKGVDIVVQRMLPSVEQLIARAKKAQAS